jgi:hypothetical protein
VESVTILAVLMAMSPHWTDASEVRSDRVIRLTPVATAIARHARTDIEAALMLASGRLESHWARRVGARGLGDRGLSIGYWQPQRRTCPLAWSAETDVDAIEASAECVSRLYRGGWASCGTPGGAFMRYNGSPTCKPKEWTRARVNTFWWSLQRLRRYDLQRANSSAYLLEGYDPGVAVGTWDHTQVLESVIGTGGAIGQDMFNGPTRPESEYPPAVKTAAQRRIWDRFRDCSQFRSSALMTYGYQIKPFNACRGFVGFDTWDLRTSTVGHACKEYNGSLPLFTEES